jgi:hypothetical protein
VLGVGVDGDENGQNNGLKVSLFDVSDPTTPKESHKVIISGVFDNKSGAYTYVDSEAYYTHKALCWNDAENTMYIPYSKRSDFRFVDGDYYQNQNVAGILAVKVDEAEKKLLKSENYTNVSTDNDMSQGFERATYIGDVIFGYSDYDDVLMSFDKTTQKQLNTLNID